MDIKVSIIKTPADFKEMLNMSTLSTQMEVFEMLKSNLKNYQIKYFKSFLMSGKDILSYIPDNQHKIYLDNLFKYGTLKYSERKKEYKNLAYYFKTMPKSKSFILNTQTKEIIHVFNFDGKGHQTYHDLTYKFTKRENILVVEKIYTYTPWYDNTGPEKTISNKYEFDLSKNICITTQK